MPFIAEARVGNSGWFQVRLWNGKLTLGDVGRLAEFYTKEAAGAWLRGNPMPEADIRIVEV